MLAVFWIEMHFYGISSNVSLVLFYKDDTGARPQNILKLLFYFQVVQIIDTDISLHHDDDMI